MSNWLDFSCNSNKLRQTYFNGFVDVSGGLHVRNDNSIYLYDNANSSSSNFSMNSNNMHIYKPEENKYYDISNSKLIYIQNVQQDIQSWLIDLSNRYFNPVFSGITSIISDNSNSGKLYVDGDASINGNLFIGGTGTNIVQNDMSINGNLYANYPDNSIPTGAVIRGTVYVPTESIVYPHDDGFAKVTNIGYSTETLVPASLQVKQELNVIGDASLNGRLYINSNESLIINGVPFTGTFSGQNGSNFNTDVSFNQNILTLGDVNIGQNLVVGGDISTNGNIYANYSGNSIPANAIIGGVGNVHITSDSITYPFDDSFSLIKENTSHTVIPSNITINGSIAVNNDSYLNSNVYISNLYVNKIYLPTQYTASVNNQLGHINKNILSNSVTLSQNNGSAAAYVAGTFTIQPGTYIYSFKITMLNNAIVSNITRLGITLSSTTNMDVEYGFDNYCNHNILQNDSITENRSGFIINSNNEPQTWNIIIATAYTGGTINIKPDSFVSFMKIN